ncbi:MAG: carboxylesterase family protein [Chitinophagaceae bacterium]
MLPAQTNNFFAVQTKIENGVIEGNYDTKTGMQFYFGVPFAKPPIGDLRWKAPQPLENWKGVLKTKSFGTTGSPGHCIRRYEKPLGRIK